MYERIDILYSPTLLSATILKFSHPYKVPARMHFIQYKVCGSTIDPHMQGDTFIHKPVPTSFASHQEGKTVTCRDGFICHPSSLPCFAGFWHGTIPKSDFIIIMTYHHHPLYGPLHELLSEISWDPELVFSQG